MKIYRLFFPTDLEPTVAVDDLLIDGPSLIPRAVDAGQGEHHCDEAEWYTCSLEVHDEKQDMDCRRGACHSCRFGPGGLLNGWGVIQQGLFVGRN